MRTKKGFSLGEVMVAMFILLVGMADAVFLTANSIRDLGDGRDAMVAASLAQEGVELVRNVRDNNVTQSTCGSGTERCTAFGKGDPDYGFPIVNINNKYKCSIDYKWGDSTGKLNCSSPKEDLHFNTSTHLYSHDSNAATATKYKRGVYISYKNPGDPDDVVATVTSVVVYGKKVLPTAEEVDHIADKCMRKDKCVYAQTHLTSWINYGE